MPAFWDVDLRYCKGHFKSLAFMSTEFRVQSTDIYAVRFEIAGQTLINQLSLSSRAKASKKRAEVEGPESWITCCLNTYASLRSLHSASFSLRSGRDDSVTYTLTVV